VVAFGPLSSLGGVVDGAGMTMGPGSTLGGAGLTGVEEPCSGFGADGGAGVGAASSVFTVMLYSGGGGVFAAFVLEHAPMDSINKV
jgi:hypothetical protein